MATPTLAWYLCDLVTGAIVCDLPITANEVVCNLAQDNAASFSFSVFDSTTPENWHELVTPLNRMLVLTINDAPAQAWWIDEAPTVGDATVTFSGHTLEACAGTMNVPDLDGSYYDTQAAYLLCTSTVALDGATTTTTLPSLRDRFGFTVTYTAASGFSDFDYASEETVTVLSAMQDLMAQARIEFRFVVRWSDNTHRGFTKYIEINPRIGGTRPDAVFDLDANGNGSVVSYQRSSAGRGANALIGSATTTGSAANLTDPQIASELLVPIASGGPGYPFVELRKSYDNLSDSADLDAALLARTQATLKRLKAGAQTWAFVLRQPGDVLPSGLAYDGDGLQPGVDFDAGDTVPYDVAARPPIEPVASSGMARLLGYTLNLQDWSCTPTLWPDPDDN